MANRPLGPRLTLAMGVPYGLAMALYLPTPTPTAFALTALGSGAFFGVSMAVTLTLLASWRGAGPERAEPNQERVLRLAGHPHALLAAARLALHRRGIGRFAVDDPEAGVLEGTTSMSLHSFGTVVSVHVGAPDAAGTCQVRLRTRPRLATQMLDYGVAARLVDEVEAAMVDAAELPTADATTHDRQRVRPHRVPQPEG